MHVCGMSSMQRMGAMCLSFFPTMVTLVWEGGIPPTVYGPSITSLHGGGGGSESGPYAPRSCASRSSPEEAKEFQYGLLRLALFRVRYPQCTNIESPIMKGHYVLLLGDLRLCCIFLSV